MGKRKKEHRKRVSARNAQKEAQKKAVMNHLKELGITPMEALKMMHEGTLKPKDDQVFGPKESLLHSPLHTTSLTQSGPVTTGDGLVAPRTTHVTPYSQAGESETKNPQDKQ